MARVSAENFAEALLGALSEYSEAASEATFRAVDAVTQETDAEIRGKAFVHWKSWQETYPGMMDEACLASIINRYASSVIGL